MIFKMIRAIKMLHQSAETDLCFEYVNENERICYTDLTTTCDIDDFENNMIEISILEGRLRVEAFVTLMESVSKKTHSSVLGPPYADFVLTVNEDCTVLYILPLPNFLHPSRRISIVISNSKISIFHVKFYCWRCHSQIDPSGFVRTYPTPKEDEFLFRKSVIELLKKRMGDAEYSKWSMELDRFKIGLNPTF